jgi:hypothetical protein
MHRASWALVAASFVAGSVVTALPRAARAVDPFEIQVYEGDINQRGQLGLEVHSNVVADPGPAAADRHRFRLTLEPSWGLHDWWELGAYLQFAFGSDASDFGGFKLRSKWMVPQRLTGSFRIGLNVELGRGTAALASDQWDTEFRPILVWTTGRFLVALNPIFGWSLSGPQRSATPDLEPAMKARVDTGLGFGVGLEYYAGLGRPTDFPPVSQQEHILYVIADLLDAGFELNLGIGRGLTTATNDWAVKAIVGLGF